MGDVRFVSSGLGLPAWNDLLGDTLKIEQRIENLGDINAFLCPSRKDHLQFHSTLNPDPN